MRGMTEKNVAVGPLLNEFLTFSLWGRKKTWNALAQIPSDCNVQLELQC